MRNTMRSLMVGVALLGGLVGTGVVAAKAAPIEFHERFGYVPQCPGEGYVWVDGYYNDGYWVPGAWVFRGQRDRDWDRGYAYYGGGYRFDNDHRRFEGRDRDDRRFEHRDRDDRRFEHGDRDDHRFRGYGGDPWAHRGDRR